jgi:hypothetical protein
MWLLDTTTLKLRHFITDIPDYVILSHTWGDGEVSFDDIAQPYAKEMAGYSKISRCCAQAVEAGFEWAWIDTVCIDKKSSAELSEAINSMYKWYCDAAICYAFISDHSVESFVSERSVVNEAFQSSRWFKRGWTLQELLAPDAIEFFDSNWRFMGTKSSLLDQIYAATNIEKQYLHDRHAIENATIATKFSWASGRTTTREEDMAYCLLGLVQVNMPMLYGEGSGAFYRLQLEIIKQTNEHTIFAWEPTEDIWRQQSIFAPSPALFKNTADLQPTFSAVHRRSETHEMTNRGLRITLPCISIDDNRVIAVLNCMSSAGKYIGIWLERTGPGTYQRLSIPRAMITEKDMDEATPVSMHIEIYNQNRRREAKHTWSMRVHDLSLTNGIYVENRFVTFSRFYSFEKGIVQEGEFLCFCVNILRNQQYVSIFLGLYKGRLWIDMSVWQYGSWTEDVEEKRKVFESQTLDQLDCTQHSFFRDSYSLSIPGGGVCQVLARKIRLGERYQWELTGSIGS